MAAPGDKRIPIAAILPIITRWSKENCVTYEAGSYQDQEAWESHLAELAGTHVRVICRIKKGGEIEHRSGKFVDYISFELADRLLCAMDCVWEWRSSLQEFYGPLPILAREIREGYELPVAA